ncbi:MAG: CapA family protein [Magnetococcales bacterium]|nr:CapA family protein [Magnetococcales bacterium]NGZ28485.1 CapA family protein [Magnetococcales bacterium]
MWLLVWAFLMGSMGAVADGERLLFAGDVMLSREVAREMEKRGHLSPWSHMSGLQPSDFAMINFEGAVGTVDRCHTHKSTPCFAVAPEMVQVIAKTGFSAAGLANNHAGDLGAEGRGQSRQSLRQAGITPLDYSDSPGFVRLGERTLAILAINTIAGVDQAKDQVLSLETARKLRLASTLADWVVVFIHWGGELRDWPQEGQVNAAKWLVKQGADLIIGHHPHVPIAPDCVNGHPVFYSLGNHIFDQKYAATKRGMLVECVVKEGILRCHPLYTRTALGTSFPRLEEKSESAKEEERQMEGCGVPARGGLEVEGWLVRPYGEPHRLVSGPTILEGGRGGVTSWRSAARHLLAIEAGRLEGRGPVKLFTVERHPSRLDAEDAPRPYVYDIAGHGLIARWRGTALAWPLLDARLLTDKDGSVLLCALHRADSFLQLNPQTRKTRTALYRWNGFGFSAAKTTRDKETACQRLFQIK